MDWDSEVARRLDLLKCTICNGTNPYVCRCAKAAWIRKQEEVACALTLEEEKEWQSFKALSFPSKMEMCTVCNTGEFSAYCACAKASWRVWNREMKASDASRPTKKTK